MEQIVVNQDLIMLDGKPLALITRSGLIKWENDGENFHCWYDEVTAEGQNKGKFRCLYEKESSSEIFLLVSPPSAPEGFNVILFDSPPQQIH